MQVTKLSHYVAVLQEFLEEYGDGECIDGEGNPMNEPEIGRQIGGNALYEFVQPDNQY